MEAKGPRVVAIHQISHIAHIFPIHGHVQTPQGKEQLIMLNLTSIEEWPQYPAPILILSFLMYLRVSLVLFCPQ